MVLMMLGLMSTSEIDDREAAEREANPRLEMEAGVVGPAVGEAVRHAVELGRVDAP